MNKHIPKDVEQLMWLIAESEDSNAAQEFERRFPDFRFELMRRMSTVKSLKASKPGKSAAAVPTFRMRQSKPGPSRTFFIGSFALGLGVFAFGSYAITQRLTSPKAPTAVVETALPAPKLNQPVQNQGFSNNPPGISAQRPGETQPTRDPNQRQIQGQTGVPPLTAQDKKDLAPYSKLQDVSVDDAPLSTIIQLIAQSSGLEVTFAPNATAGGGTDFDKVISVDYRQMSGLDMLRRLGDEHGFTPMYQGENQFLIVPSVSKSPILNPGE